jgi:hypothetical protein
MANPLVSTTFVGNGIVKPTKSGNERRKLRKTLSEHPAPTGDDKPSREYAAASKALQSFVASHGDDFALVLTGEFRRINADGEIVNPDAEPQTSIRIRVSDYPAAIASLTWNDERTEVTSVTVMLGQRGRGRVAGLSADDLV